jgi:hypothetical protein
MTQPVFEAESDDDDLLVRLDSVDRSLLKIIATDYSAIQEETNVALYKKKILQLFALNTMD